MRVILGSGPCLFCGDLVCTKEELEVLNRNSRKSEQLLNKLLGTKKDGGNSLNKAEQHKNKLLEFDKNCEKRTQVIDDESDYFSVDSNKWLSKKQREALKKREEEIRERRHGSRLNRKITFDFAGRRVVEEEPLADYDPSKDDVVKRIMEEDDRKSRQGMNNADQMANKVLEEGDVVNPFIDVPRPQVSRFIYRETK